MASAFAPGKCILFGEHAVVFGYPAVAVAIEQGVVVSVEESSEWVLEGAPFNPSRHPHITHMIKTVFDYDGPPLDLDVKSSLFSAAGMGSSAALSNAIKSTRMGGYLNILGVYGSDPKVPINEIVFRYLHVKGINGRRMWATWDAMQELLVEGELNIESVLSHRMPWTEYKQAIALMLTGECGKVVLDFD